jgi:hypothetical protein
MPTSYKTLGQVSPAAATYESLYQVPAGNTQAIISTVTVANCTTSATTYRLGVTASATAASAIALNELIAFDVAIAANDTVALTLGLTMNDQEKLIGRAAAASVAFGVFGSEIS